MKKNIIITVLSIVIISMLFCGFVFSCQHKEYAKGGIVTEVNHEVDLVTVEDCNGFVWQFFGSEEWTRGDFCVMLMDDNGSPDYILDDIIIDTTNCGHDF